jgi:hypothetical protein
MPKLKNLTIKTTESHAYVVCHQIQSVKIEKVENFTIKFLPNNFERRATLLSCCPNAKNVKILNFSIISEDELEIFLRSAENVEEIFVNGNLKFNDEILNLLIDSKVKRIKICDENKTQKIPEKLKNSEIKIFILGSLESEIY